MERNSLYEVLAHILKSKQNLLSRSVMNILLELVGKSRSDSEYAVIGNILAYRHLFLEFELWQKDHEIQEYHLQQFEYFIKDNERSDFNLKRLHVGKSLGDKVFHLTEIHCNRLRGYGKKSRTKKNLNLMFFLRTLLSISESQLFSTKTSNHYLSTSL
jgi:hypothetical protein